MKGTKRIVAFATLAVILMGWAMVQAGEARSNSPMQGMGGHGGMFQAALSRLNLSETQKQDVANVLKQHRGEMQGLREQMFAARQAVFKAVAANPPDEAAVREAAAKAADVEVELAVNRAKVFNEIRSLLTPEQQATFQQLADQCAAHRQQGFQHKGRMMDRWTDENSSL